MHREVVIFFTIIAGALALVYGLVFLLKLPLPFVFAVLAGIVLIAYFFPRFEAFKEYERGVVFRFGKFDRVVGPGWIPLFGHVEDAVRVDLRTQTIDIEPQEVITKDEIKIKVDAIVYMQIVNPRKVVVEVKDVKNSVKQVIYANIREAVSKMTVTEVLTKTDEINAQLKEVLEQVAHDWGVQVTRVEIQRVELPQLLVEANQKRKAAEEFKTRLETEARARQIALEILNEAASKLSAETMAYLYLEALKRVGEGKSTKIVVPMELTKLAQALADKTGI